MKTYYLIRRLYLTLTQKQLNLLSSLQIYRIFCYPNILDNINICVCFVGFYVHFENISFIWIRHHYRWRASNLNLYSAIMAIKQWWFLSVSQWQWHRSSCMMVISEDPWQSHVLPSAWMWSCHNLLLRIRSVSTRLPTYKANALSTNKCHQRRGSLNNFWVGLSQLGHNQEGRREQSGRDDNFRRTGDHLGNIPSVGISRDHLMLVTLDKIVNVPSVRLPLHVPNLKSSIPEQ